jgi:hypothetical protein
LRRIIYREQEMPKYTATTNLDGYSTVAERIELFYKERPNGRITTKLVSRADREITVKAFVYRDREESRPAATGYAAEREGTPRQRGRG